MNNLGLTHVYTGDGKGKTSAAMGLATRAVGQGCKVFIVQFMKGGAYTGEMVAAKNFLPNIQFEQYGRHCIKEEKQMKLMGMEMGIHYFDYVRDNIECGTCRYCFLNDDLQAKFVQEALDRALHLVSSGEYDLVILDEIITAVQFGFLKSHEVTHVIEKKAENTELVLTGRGATQDIKDAADYVTIMQQDKHPIDKGIFARRAIEY
ncbi:MAG: cob(I)yrinic acid a,c-diamide adenosyltransferase [Candidatus Nanoarchaeia archaeon]